MKPATEAERRWVEQWRIAGPLLEQIKTEELRAMTEEEARVAAEDLLSAVPLANSWSHDAHASGLVEQQRWFKKARES